MPARCCAMGWARRTSTRSRSIPATISPRSTPAHTGSFPAHLRLRRAGGRLLAGRLRVPGGVPHLPRDLARGLGTLAERKAVYGYHGSAREANMWGWPGRAAGPLRRARRTGQRQQLLHAPAAGLRGGGRGPALSAEGLIKWH